jgi:RND family efflux transporter MFP subunit
LQRKIQDEIDRLPEKYRAPVLLCYLEGMTHEEAAGQLRLPVGTVKTRLVRARARLRGPLLRRGLAPALVTAWMHSDVQAAVPAQLTEQTIQSAIRIASGKATAPVAALVEGVLNAMFFAKLKTLAACFSALLCLLVVSTMLISALSRLARSSPPDGARPSEAGQEREVIVQSVGRSDSQRSTTQPGTVKAYEWANLVPRLSGYVKTMNVDIGDSVKRGQVLAEIDPPELEAERERARAVMEQARARVTTAQAAVVLARSSIEVEKAKGETVAARLNGANSALRYRENTFKRLKELASKNAVEQRLVEETQDGVETARAALTEAKAQLVSARAAVDEANAKVHAAQSQVVEAEAALRAAEADFHKATIMFDATRILAPMNGIVTMRGNHVGDFVRPATTSAIEPLFTVSRTDKMRVVVGVPDGDSPFLDKGDRATVRFDALGNRVYHGAVSRTAMSEDTSDRTERTEIDLDNADGSLRSGQFARVTIILQNRLNVLSLPSSALVSRSEGRKAVCFRVVDRRAKRTELKIGEEALGLVEVVDGLEQGDQVIVNPDAGLTDGQVVSARQGASRKQQ